jgi:hypothetical protein
MEGTMTHLSARLAGLLAILLAVSLLAASLPAVASDSHRPARHSVSLKLGGFFPEGDSEQWDFQEEVFDSEVDEFDDVALALEYNYQFSNHFAVSGESMFFEGRDKSDFTDYVDQFRQKTELEILTVAASILWQPGGKFRSGSGGYPGKLRTVVPYLGVGIGAMFWDYETRVQVLYPPRYYTLLDQERDDGTSFLAAGTVGIEIPVWGPITVLVEGKYYWADDDLDDDFFGPRELDLDGFSAMAGAAFRF